MSLQSRPASRAARKPLTDDAARASAGASSRALARVTGVRLRRLHALFSRHWTRHFRGQGVELSSVQGGLLLLIRENPGLAQAAFARLLDIEPPSLAQTLAPLVEAGFVERRPAAHDGRAMALTLTQAGERIARVIEEAQPQHEARLLAGLNQQERRTLIALLDKAVASAERAMSAEQHLKREGGSNVRS